jgi:Acyl dehydratase
MRRYYEDIEVGDRDEYGGRKVTKEEMVEFAKKYDPQPFHVDEEAAQESFFGGLVASGWFTASVVMRMTVEYRLDEWASTGASGVGDLRWHAPVYPGDTLTVRTEVIEKESRDKKTGIIRYDEEVLNQDGEVVMSMEPMVLFERRGSKTGSNEQNDD